jgi:hypothetical protein
MVENGISCRGLVEKPQRKYPLRRPKRRCEDISKRILKEYYARAWARFIRVRIGTSGGLL